jgi:predicted DCC family thiol-disulfide oxidoreductase YuxK
MGSAKRHYLLYDGECDFCRTWADWLRKRDIRSQRFCVMPWQDAPSPPMTPLLQVQAREAVQLVSSDDRHLHGGRAVLFALRETGWHPAIVGLLEHRPFVWIVDFGYRIVAANRPSFGWLRPRG